MPRLARLSVLLLAAVALAACNRQGPQLPTGQGKTADADASQREGGIDTVTVDPNAAFVGAAVDANGEIAEPAREFKVGQTVYVSVPSKGRKLGSEVEVFWFHQDRRSRKDERKPISGPFTVFEFQPTETGQYNTEVDVNGRPIALVQFEVK